MCKCCSLKYWFIFFNVLFLESGVALITIGALQYSTYSQMATFAGNSLSKIAIVLIAVGATIVLISFLGHFGAFINNSSMLECFICLLIAIIILEVLTGAAFYIFHSRTALLQMSNAINTEARAVIYDYRPEKIRAIKRIQEKFSCCGADNYTDWSRSVGWVTQGAVPDSCCLVKSVGCGKDMTKIHTKGCIRAIKLSLLVWGSAVSIGLGVTELFGVMFGVCLCRDIKRKNYENLL
ncbi:CD63 antigen-like [Mastacembelus armatus]|uniref:CD63 antigen-like n=1 Tax=Mastacembelus armatus TaxID=205130 RepID=UPI000E46583E|nr:CD63 antigen-like [Mastacembelus armatus]